MRAHIKKYDKMIVFSNDSIVPIAVDDSSFTFEISYDIDITSFALADVSNVQFTAITVSTSDKQISSLTTENFVKRVVAKKRGNDNLSSLEQNIVASSQKTTKLEQQLKDDTTRAQMGRTGTLSTSSTVFSPLQAVKKTTSIKSRSISKSKQASNSIAKPAPSSTMNKNSTLELSTIQKLAEKKNDSRIASGESYKSMAANLIKEGIDPAALAIAPTDSIKSVLNGTSRTVLITQLPIEKNLTTIIKNTIADKNPTTTQDNDVDLSFIDEEKEERKTSDDVHLVIERQKTTAKQYKHELIIDRRALKSMSLLIQADVLDKRGILISSNREMIRIPESINLFSVPRIAPNILAKNVDNTHMLEIKQVDRTASGFILYRRIIDTAKKIGGRFEVITRGDLRHGEIFKTKLKSTNSSSVTIYRVVPVGASKNNGVFNSAVIASTGEPSVLVGTLILRADNGQIGIEVSNLTLDARFVQLYRRDLTTLETNMTPLGSYQPVIDEKSTLIDNSSILKVGHTYEYGVNVITKKNLNTRLASTVLYEHRIVDETKPTLDIAAKTTNRSADGSKVVSFEIIEKQENRGFNVVKDLLERAGIADKFDEILTSEKEKFKDLFATRVRRIDDLTGEIVEFDVSAESTFIDSPEMSRDPIKDDHSYTYEIMPVIRPAAQLFKSFKSKQLDRNGQEYNMKPFKFLNPTTLKNGTVVSSDIEHSSNDELLRGLTGNVKRFTETASKQKPGLTNVRGDIISERLLKLSWTLIGSGNEIDHFLIHRKTALGTSVIGQVHPINDSGDVEFIRELDENDFGNITYGVSIVTNDYELLVGDTADNLHVE